MGIQKVRKRTTQQGIDKNPRTYFRQSLTQKRENKCAKINILQQNASYSLTIHRYK